MNTLTYQGYIARIKFDNRDNIFVGYPIKEGHFFVGAGFTPAL